MSANGRNHARHQHAVVHSGLEKCLISIIRIDVHLAQIPDYPCANADVHVGDRY